MAGSLLALSVRPGPSARRPAAAVRAGGGVTPARLPDAGRIAHAWGGVRAWAAPHLGAAGVGRGCAARAEAETEGRQSDFALTNSFDYSVARDGGELVVRPLALDDVEATAMILCRAFAGTPEGKPILLIRQYLEDQVAAVPGAVSLTATLVKDGEREIVGLVDLSFGPETREDFATLPVPEYACYLSNMSVSDQHRRKGIAAAMLEACEELALDRDFGQIYLHVRIGDTPAEQLYLKGGFEVLQEDSAGAALFGGSKIPRRRALMAKALDLFA